MKKLIAFFVFALIVNASAQYGGGAYALKSGSNITDPAAFRTAIGVEQSVFPSLRAWLLNPIYSTGIGIIGDSTGAGSAWPLAMYNIMSNAYPNLTLRFWQLDTTTTNMSLLYERIGSGGVRGLSWTNSTIFAEVPNFPAVTNEIDVSVKATLATWSNSQFLVSRPVSGGQNGTIVINSGLIYFYYQSPTNNNDSVNPWSSSYSFSNGQTGWVRATAKGSNAYNQLEVRVYTSTNGTNWTQRGISTNRPAQNFTTNGATIYAGNSGSALTQGVYHAISWRDGIDGQDLMPPLDQWTYSVPKNVTSTGSVAFTFWNGSWPGFKSDPVNFTNLDGWTSDLVKKCVPYHISEIIENSGLNDTVNSTSPKYRSTYQHMANLTTAITSAVPQASIAVLTQNPVSQTNAYVRSMGVNAQHQASAANQMGMGVIDAYANFIKLNGTNDVTYDGTHPSAGQQTTNGLYIYNRIFN